MQKVIFPRFMTPDLVAEAKKVVNSPEIYFNRPIARRIAWATLMTRRRRNVDMNRIAAMQKEIGGV